MLADLYRYAHTTHTTYHTYQKVFFFDGNREIIHPTQSTYSTMVLHPSKTALSLKSIRPKKNTQVGSLLSCPSCDYTCHKSTRLNNHMNAVHLGVKPFHCDQCPSAFPNRFHILINFWIFSSPLFSHQKWVETTHDHPHRGTSLQVPILWQRCSEQAEPDFAHQNTHRRKAFHM